MTRKHEREFLKLAAVWLECRWCVMGNQITAAEEVILHRCENYADLQFHMLGCVDFQAEMRMFMKARQKDFLTTRAQMT